MNEIIQQVLPLVVGFLSSLLVEGAKRVQSIPVNAGQVAKLRVLLGVLVLGGNALSAFLNGNLDSFAAGDQVSLLLNSSISWVSGHLMYKLALKK
jgi:hypothetical protein